MAVSITEKMNGCKVITVEVKVTKRLLTKFGEDNPGDVVTAAVYRVLASHVELRDKPDAGYSEKLVVWSREDLTSYCSRLPVPIQRDLRRGKISEKTFKVSLPAWAISKRILKKIGYEPMVSVEVEITEKSLQGYFGGGMSTIIEAVDLLLKGRCVSYLPTGLKSGHELNIYNYKNKGFISTSIPETIYNTAKRSKLGPVKFRTTLPVWALKKSVVVKDSTLPVR